MGVLFTYCVQSLASAEIHTHTEKSCLTRGIRWCLCGILKEEEEELSRLWWGRGVEMLSGEREGVVPVREPSGSGSRLEQVPTCRKAAEVGGRQKSWRDRTRKTQDRLGQQPPLTPFSVGHC